METNKTLEEWRKNYNAILGFLFESDDFDANTKRIFTELCHQPVEKALYDAIVDGVTREEVEKKDDFDTLLCKGAKLYFLHSKFNVKLDRARYMTADPKEETRDNFLLDCIIEVMRTRRPELNELLKENVQPTEEDLAKDGFSLIGFENEALKTMIFKKYQEQYRNPDIKVDKNSLFIPSEIDVCSDFDKYVNDLIDLQDSRYHNRFSFNYLWTHATGKRRAVTFEVRRPTKNELYIFCFGGAFDYETFTRMKSALIAEIDAGIYHGDNPRSAMRRKRQYETVDDRDILLRHFLENINTRFECAKHENKQGTDHIPYTLLKKVDEELIKHHFQPLVRRRAKEADDEELFE